jgi:uncharacterized membrane protein YfcA
VSRHTRLDWHTVKELEKIGHARDWLLLAAIGALAGFLSGLLGIGGGLIVVPGLLLVLPRFGVHGPETIKIAMATSTTVMVLTAVSGAQGHLINRAVDWQAVRRLAPCLVLGALAAPQLAAVIGGEQLMLVFTAFPLSMFSSLLVLRPTAPSPLRGSSRLEHPARRRAGGETGSAPQGAGIVRERLRHGTHLHPGRHGLGIAPFSVPLLSAHMALPWAIATTAALLFPWPP